MPILADLDRAFDDLWLHTEQLPVLLEEWQKLVSEALQTQDVDESFLNEFEAYMDRWEKVLRENRALIHQHQESLKEKLKKGEPSVSEKELQKKFRKDDA